MTTPTPVYDRAPSPELQALLLPGGFLAPLVGLASRKTGGHYHDVHFRANDEVHVYRGLTRLVTVSKTSNDEVRLTAHSTYRVQQCAQDFLRRWRVDEPGFSEGLDHYLSEVSVSASFLLNEGKVQEQWSEVNAPWVPFDREGVLSGPHAMGRDFPQVQAALDQLTGLSQRSGWAPPNPTGVEIDQLAIDPLGRLVLMELKDTSKGNAEVYYSPFQLLQYVWEWHGALEAVRNGLQAVIRARVAVGLAPPDVPPLTRGIRASVGFGPDKRSSEVKRRYEKVLKIVNNHLPADVGPIEILEHTDAGPSLLTRPERTPATTGLIDKAGRELH